MNEAVWYEGGVGVHGYLKQCSMKVGWVYMGWMKQCGMKVGDTWVKMPAGS